MARLAKSLEHLRAQVNAAYPTRNKASDGWIADAAHAARASDHNPNSAGVVCALDLTHDPATFDAHKAADRLRANRHPNLKYIISNQRIAGAWTGWAWQPYSGVNPHTKHIHISVGVGSDGQSQPPYDDTTNWNIGDTMTEDGVRYGYLAVTRNQPTAAQLKYWIGRDPQEFTKALYGLSDEYLVKAQSQVTELTKVVKIKDDEIAKLNAQLAVENEDTVNLNKLGEALRWVIARLGLKG